MKVIKDEVATLKRGRRVTVELEPNEYLPTTASAGKWRTLWPGTSSSTRTQSAGAASHRCGRTHEDRC
jgi:hypothetical protein